MLLTGGCVTGSRSPGARREGMMMEPDPIAVWKQTQGSGSGNTAGAQHPHHHYDDHDSSGFGTPTGNDGGGSEVYSARDAASEASALSPDGHGGMSHLSSPDGPLALSGSEGNLQQDALTTLSQFPTPGEPRQRNYKLFMVPREEALDEYGRPVLLEDLPSPIAEATPLPQQQGTSSPPKGPSRGGAVTGGTGLLYHPAQLLFGDMGGTDAEGEDGQFSKQYWMPDRLCRSCYDCEQPFTMLRRRHHCRFCGQVFCSSCAGYYADGSTLGYGTGAVRCCQMCLDHVNKAKAPVPPVGAHHHQGHQQAYGMASPSDHSGSPHSQGDHRAATEAGRSPPRTKFGFDLTSMMHQVPPSSSSTCSSTTTPSASSAASTPTAAHGMHILNNHTTSSTATGGSASRGAPRLPQPGGSQLQQQAGIGSSTPTGAMALILPTTTTTHHPDAPPLHPPPTTTTSSSTAATHAPHTHAHAPTPTPSQQPLGERASARAAVGATGVQGPAARNSPLRPPNAPSTSVFEQALELAASSLAHHTHSSPHHRNGPTHADRAQRHTHAHAHTQGGGGESGACAGGNGRDGAATGGGGGVDVGGGGGGGVGRGGMDADGMSVRSVMRAESVAELEAATGYDDAMEYEAVMDKAALDHWTAMVRQLITASPIIPEDTHDTWVHMVTRLVRAATETVNPDIRSGDLMDIRHYVTVKVIPGGDISECAYVDGLVFRKNVANKRMLRDIHRPRILLLSGGIEFQRTESRMTSLDTLVDQEAKYMQILVEKILALKPDLLLAGKAVSRWAQEHLTANRVALMQHVKPQVLGRVARMCGARILASTDHMMSQHGSLNALGTCGRFRLVAYGSNGAHRVGGSDSSTPQHLSDPLPYEYPTTGWDDDEADDEYDSIKALPAPVFACPHLHRKRTYGYLEGCSRSLGCSLILRGDSEPVLKELKRIVRLAVNVAYNLRLERAYLADRFAVLGGPGVVPGKRILSSSFDVDLREPYKTAFKEGMRVLPASPFEHQQLLMTSVWMRDRHQCSTAEVKRISYYYSPQDVSLGQFLSGSCFNADLRCQNVKCQKPMTDHMMSFSHRDGRVSITTVRLSKSLHDIVASSNHHTSTHPCVPSSSMTSSTAAATAPSTHTHHTPSTLSAHTHTHTAPNATQSSSATAAQDAAAAAALQAKAQVDLMLQRPIYMCSWCKVCNAVVTPLVEMSDETWKWSFGKMLEVMFYNSTARARPSVAGCSHSMQRDHVLWFGCGDTAARFEYEHVLPYRVVANSALTLKFPQAYHDREIKRQLTRTWEFATKLFKAFQERLEEMNNEVKELGPIITTGQPPTSPAPNAPPAGPSQSDLESELALILKELALMETEVKQLATTTAEQVSYLLDRCRIVLDSHEPPLPPPRPHTHHPPPQSTSSAPVGPPPPHADVSASGSAKREMRAQQQQQQQLQKQQDGSVIDGLPLTRASATTDSGNTCTPGSVSSDGGGGGGSGSGGGGGGDAGTGDAKDKDRANGDANSNSCPFDRPVDRKELEMFPRRCQRSIYVQALTWNERLMVAGHGLASITAQVLQNLPPQQANSKETTLIGSPGRVHTPKGELDEAAEPRPPMEDLTLTVEKEQQVTFCLAADTPDVASKHQTVLTAPPPPLTRTASRSSTVSVMLSRRLHSRISVGSVSTKDTYRSTSLTAALLKLLGGRDYLEDCALQYAVDLDELAAPLGRLGLEPLRNGQLVIPVMDEFPSTIIAYALSCPEYLSKFRDFMLQFWAWRTCLPEFKASVEALNALATPSPSPALATDHSSATPTDTAATGGGGAGGGDEDGDGGGGVSDYGEEGDGVEGSSVRLTADVTPPPPRTMPAAPAAPADPLHTAADLSTPGVAPRTYTPLSPSPPPRGRTGKPMTTTTTLATLVASDIAAAAAAGVVTETDGGDGGGDADGGGRSGVVGVDRGVQQWEDVLGVQADGGVSRSSSVDEIERILTGAREAGIGGGGGVEVLGGMAGGGTTQTHAVTPLASAATTPPPPTSITTSAADGHFPAQQTQTPLSQTPQPSPPPLDTTTTTPTTATKLNPNQRSTTTSTPTPAPLRSSMSSSVPVTIITPRSPSRAELRRQMRWPEKSHIKVRFEDRDQTGEVLAKFTVNVYWATQFQAFRYAFLGEDPLMDDAKFIKSLASSAKFDATGGKSGATFSITDDGRFVLKQINDKELAMFLEAAPAYFDYMSKALFEGQRTVLCKILGLYETESYSKTTKKQIFSQLVVMPNIFFQRNIHRTYDLKGSSRSRYIAISREEAEGDHALHYSQQQQQSGGGSGGGGGGHGHNPALPPPRLPQRTVSDEPLRGAVRPSVPLPPPQHQHREGLDGERPPSSGATTQDKDIEAASNRLSDPGARLPSSLTALASPAQAEDTGRDTDSHATPMSQQQQVVATSSSTRAVDGSSSAAAKEAQPPLPLPPTSSTTTTTHTASSSSSSTRRKIRRTLLDENLMEFTDGRPLPVCCPDQAFFHDAIVNDTLFLSVIKIIDYSILVGVDEENKELVVGIIDYMRQYDIIKKMERMGKSVGMIAGQAEPTVIQPQPYRQRFQTAMERYFMKVPDKWIAEAS